MWVHPNDLVYIRIADDVVTTTEDHPFWNATDRQWEGPQEFDAGDRVLTANGNLLVTRGLVPDSWHTGNAYNLTVNDIHTFYVVVAGEAVLVHNFGRCGWIHEDLLQTKFEKHGSEMGFDNATAYGMAAEDLVARGGIDPSVLVKVDGNTRYILDPATGEFAINNVERGIVNYFAPTNPADYFKGRPGAVMP